MKISFNMRFSDSDLSYLGVKFKSNQDRIDEINKYFMRMYNHIPELESIAIEEKRVKLTLDHNDLEGVDHEAFSIAVDFMKLEEYSSVIEFLETMSSKHPNNGLICFFLGFAYSSLKKDLDAIPLYLRATKVLPFFYNAYNELAFSYMRIGEHELAVKNFNLALLYKNSFIHFEEEVTVPLNNYQTLLACVIEDDLLGYDAFVKRGKFLLDQGVYNN